MKKYICFLVLSGFSIAGWSIPISSVGGVDDFLSSAKLSDSGQGTEERWVESVLGLAANSVSLDYKEENSTTLWQAVDGLFATYAFKLSVEPAYYLLKLGVGNSNADTHYLFQNLYDLSWAVVDFQEMLDGQSLRFNFGRISHVSEFNSTSVTEPATLVLLGLGLIALGGLRRRL